MDISSFISVPMLAIRFYLRCLKVAFTHAWGVAGNISAAIAILVASYIQWKGGDEAMKNSFITHLNAMGGWGWALVVAGVIAIIRLLMAPYWLWKEEKERADSLETELQSTKWPNFIGSIAHIHVLEVPPLGPIAALFVIIKNTGAPSIVDNFACSHHLPNVEPSTSVMFKPLNDFNCNGVVLMASDEISKMAEDVIPNGGKDQGIAFCSFKNRTTSQLGDPSGFYLFSFKDTSGKKHEFKTDIKKESPNMAFMIPGFASRMGNPLEFGDDPAKKVVKKKKQKK